MTDFTQVLALDRARGTNRRSRILGRSGYVHAGLKAALGAVTMGILATAASVIPASAMPSFARQTGMECSACHTSIPSLTAYGRNFKVTGYTEYSGKATGLPIAALLIGGFTHTQKPQSAPPLASSTKTNDIVSLDQFGVFYAGKIATDLGAFVQVTYDPAAGAWAWDNTDIRYAKTATVFGQSGVWGLSLNNNPTVQDLWATTPAWGYPAFSSAVAPEFGLPETQLIGGNFGLGGLVMGLTGYTLLDNGLYMEFGGYNSLSQAALTKLGAGGAGYDVAGFAPYARVAYSQSVAGGTLMVGAIGMMSNIRPNYTSALGLDHYVNYGLDAQYDYTGDNYGLMFKARTLVEHKTLTASVAGGTATNVNNTLNRTDISLTYYKPKWSIIGALANVNGSSDVLLYGGSSATNSPNGSSVSLEVNYSPWMDGGPTRFPTSNVKLGVRYTHYMSLYGGTTNFDGAGHNASDNNTLFVYSAIGF